MKTHRQSGFTIVELLVVIVVIAILATITSVAYTGVQERGRDAKRISDLKHLQTAIEHYKLDNGHYPSTVISGTTYWLGKCSTFYNVDDYIPGLAPDYIDKLPYEQYYNSSSQCYVYRSDGTDFSLVSYLSAESICGGDPGASCNTSEIQAMDRLNHTENSFAVYSPGAKYW